MSTAQLGTGLRSIYLSLVSTTALLSQRGASLHLCIVLTQPKPQGSPSK